MQRVADGMVLPVELIISEAKRWGLADEVALQVLASGRVNVLCTGSRADSFVDHLLQLQTKGCFASR
jgi:hypothetical protein